MSQPELLKRVVEVLNRAGVPYMMVGSMVSSLQGEPRSTHDIDIVVQITPEAGEQLVAAFPLPDYLLDPLAVRPAIHNHQMFNLLDNVGGDKVDFWVLAFDPYKRTAFERRIPARVGGIDVWVQAPEDTILSKLHWAKEAGGSEKQFHDALGVYELQYGRLDVVYMDDWAKRLGVDEDWHRIRAEADVEDV
jgi:predicted nucleotidyltransferase